LLSSMLLQEAEKQKQRELSLKRDIRSSQSNSGGSDNEKSANASGSRRLALIGYVDGLAPGSHQSHVQRGFREDSEQWWASAVAAFLSARGHKKGRHLEQVVKQLILFSPHPWISLISDIVHAWSMNVLTGPVLLTSTSLITLLLYFFDHSSFLTCLRISLVPPRLHVALM
jgi:hypothetical protein